MKTYDKPKNAVHIETGKVLPRGIPFEHGRIYFLEREYEDNLVGLYMYNSATPEWVLIGDQRNLTVNNLTTIDPITFALTNNKTTYGKMFANVILSEDNTHARLNVKGVGNTEALGFEVWNSDLGGSVFTADTNGITWRGKDVYHSGNLEVSNFQPRTQARDVRQKYQSVVGELLFVNTKLGPVEVKLPFEYAMGDSIKIWDDEGTFDEHECIVKPREGQLINGSEDPIILDVKNVIATFYYHNEHKGWRIELTTPATHDIK